MLWVAREVIKGSLSPTQSLLILLLPPWNLSSTRDSEQHFSEPWFQIWIPSLSRELEKVRLGGVQNLSHGLKFESLVQLGIQNNIFLRHGLEFESLVQLGIQNNLFLRHGFKFESLVQIGFQKINFF